MLESFTSKLDKNFFVGYFFPCLFFVALNLAFEYFNALPFGFLPLLKEFDTSWAIAIVFATALFMGLLLVNLNRPIIMLYEGYRFRSFRFFITRQSQQWHKLYDRLNCLIEEYGELTPEEEKEGHASRLRSEINELGYRAHILFPPKSDAVLPTRLGNAIRAFEGYAYDRYRIEPLIIWSRLLAVLPTQFLDKLQTVSADFNFLINTVLLVQFFALELLVVAIYSLSPLLLSWVVIDFVISYLIYRVAVSRAIDWGFMFNTAFDLYRRDLLKQWGFPLPSSIDEEKILWDKIWMFVIYKETRDLVFLGEKLKTGVGN